VQRASHESAQHQVSVLERKAESTEALPMMKSLTRQIMYAWRWIAHDQEFRA